MAGQRPAAPLVPPLTRATAGLRARSRETIPAAQIVFVNGHADMDKYIKRENLPKALGGLLEDPKHPLAPQTYYPSVFPDLKHLPAEAWTTTIPLCTAPAVERTVGAHRKADTPPRASSAPYAALPRSLSAGAKQKASRRGACDRCAGRRRRGGVGDRWGRGFALPVGRVCWLFRRGGPVARRGPQHGSGRCRGRGRSQWRDLVKALWVH